MRGVSRLRGGLLALEEETTKKRRPRRGVSAAKISAGSKRSLPGQEQSTRTADPKARKTGRGWQGSPITILRIPCPVFFYLFNNLLDVCGVREACQ